MRIGELARQAGISVQAVRFYERRRLLPRPNRTPAGYRQYQARDLEIVLMIKRLQRFGCTLKEVRRVLELFALPSEDAGRTPYPRGSHECLREAADLADQKLKALNEQIQSLVATRDELLGMLAEMRAKLSPTRKKSSPRRLIVKSRAS
jgi:DNA-binding transcriptional MerR regulator